MKRWLWIPLTLVTAAIVFYCLDRGSIPVPSEPRAKPRAFVPPPMQTTKIPTPPEIAPVKPRPPVFPWESKTK